MNHSASATVSASSSQSGCLVEARGIVRRYGGHTALKGVDVRLVRGAVNVLIGENGAGKSTLMKILAGVEQPDAGEILFDGAPVTIHSPREATALGIAIVHQELSVLPNLDVAENIFAGRELVKALTVIDRAGEDVRSTDALKRLRHPLPVALPVAQLSLGARQMVELARAAAFGARLLILDEPTSALSTAETEALFVVIDDLRRAGVTVVYISHRLHELMHLGDHFTVLRGGEVVGVGPRAEVTREWIVERMSGRASTSDLQPRTTAMDAPIVLGVNGASLSASTGNEEAQSPVHDVSFSLRRGEVLGLYGLLGAGRTELIEALAGARRLSSGSIEVNGHVVRIATVADSVRAGVVLVPEDRQRDGLVPELSIRENIALAAATGGPLLSKKEETARSRELVRELNIAAHDLELPVTALSGGNQQKVLLARCLLRKPAVLLLDEPTRGVDVGAKAEIYRTLRRLAEDGLTVLFTSSEIEETRTLADRVLVLCQGRIAAEFTAADATDEALFAAASPRVTADVLTGVAA